MSVNATNIPWLRLRALQLAGDEEFRSCLTAITKAIGIMESLTLWTQLDRARRPKNIAKFVEAPMHKLDLISQEFARKTEELLEQHLVHPLLDKRIRYRQHAIQSLSEIHTDHHPATFKAFVFRNGNHRTSRKDAI
ncbi:hypothetical protein Slin15195_G044630 [Septoria linicola]|uniref:Uncharacterized protein n=1 Tax=Septoria linicola TaxID=215465 RepID=A0A9Q9AN18_9PEZI|nr:hypothetical protein Slin14017_G048150 [Septoria linicola]USW51144.1 hypothetical protein Slin15195_G044630 [Septoria linicola]